MSAVGVGRYQKVQVSTVSPARLLVMLFDGILRFVGEAKSAMEQKDLGRAGERIGRAHAIFAELASTLDPSQAPELCENLTALYAFCMRRLLLANLNQDPAILGEIADTVRPLRDGWAEVASASG